MTFVVAAVQATMIDTFAVRSGAQTVRWDINVGGTAKETKRTQTEKIKKRARSTRSNK